MSLLLDALKKAADDKKKISQENSAESKLSNGTTLLSDATGVTHEEAIEATEELTLDPVESGKGVAEVDELVMEPEVDEAISAAKTPSSKQTENLNDSGATSYTVSDEALSMLIYKTNRDVKQSKRLVIVSVLLASVVILGAGGVYYYMDMQIEIAALERKHQIAMHSMELKTNKEKVPEKSKIIRNLVGDTGLNDKVQYAKKHIAAKNNSQQLKLLARKTLKTAAAPSAVSFQKTNKADPVAEKLEQAWTAYEAAQYDRAKILYKEILVIEKNNRDALLGQGAIAIIEKNNKLARRIYVSLLKQDPRDPVASAALASLRNSATETDEKYLLNTLQANPDDAHLNFALGNVYAQQGKWKQAQKSYFNAWQGDNTNADYIFNLAVSMDQLEKPKQALAFYHKCLNQSANKQVVFSREAVRKRIAELSEL